MTKPDSISFASVWDAIEDEPGLAEDMRQRSVLGSTLLHHIQEQGWDVGRAAQSLGVPQASILALVSGDIDALSRPMLTEMCEAAGLATRQ